jgi:hypothetical protein
VVPALNMGPPYPAASALPGSSETWAPGIVLHKSSFCRRGRRCGLRFLPFGTSEEYYAAGFHGLADSRKESLVAACRRPPTGVLPDQGEMLVSRTTRPYIGLRVIPQQSQLACYKPAYLRWNDFKAVRDIPEIIQCLQKQCHAAAICVTPALEQKRQLGGCQEKVLDRIFRASTKNDELSAWLPHQWQLRQTAPPLTQ